MRDYGFMPDMMPENAQGIPARITAVHKERYVLACEYGEVYGRLKTKEYFGGYEEFPTTGDFVLINYNPRGDSQIIKTLPRKTFFSRRDPAPGRGEQAVVANFDYVFIMQSLNQDYNPKRLERYLTLAWQSGAIPVVVLTKADLMEDCNDYIQITVKAGIPTTHRQLIMLKNGAMIIDTPGMRELGMWDVTIGLGEAFADVEQFLGRCRFSDCKHQTEPGCAIKEAIANGELSKERWESYWKLGSEAKYFHDKGAFLRKKQQRNCNTPLFPKS